MECGTQRRWPNVDGFRLVVSEMGLDAEDVHSSTLCAIFNFRSKNDEPDDRLTESDSSQLKKYEQRCGFSVHFSFQYFFDFMDVMFPFNCAVNFQLILLDFVKEFANFTWLRTD